MRSEQKDKEVVVTSKKPYEKPAIVAEKVFETMALSCGSVGIACVGAPPKS